MQRLVWIGFFVLAALWTLLALAAHAFGQWALQALADSSLGNLAVRAAESPAAQWLTPWIGGEAVRVLQDIMLTLAGWLQSGLPVLGALDGWVAPLVWIAWGLGMVLLAGAALLAGWVLQRRAAFNWQAGHLRP